MFESRSMCSRPCVWPALILKIGHTMQELAVDDFIGGVFACLGVLCAFCVQAIMFFILGFWSGRKFQCDSPRQDPAIALPVNVPVQYQPPLQPVGAPVNGQAHTAVQGYPMVQPHPPPPPPENQIPEPLPPPTIRRRTRPKASMQSMGDLRGWTL